MPRSDVGQPRHWDTPPERHPKELTTPVLEVVCVLPHQGDPEICTSARGTRLLPHTLTRPQRRAGAELAGRVPLPPPCWASQPLSASAPPQLLPGEPQHRLPLRAMEGTTLGEAVQAAGRLRRGGTRGVQA